MTIRERLLLSTAVRFRPDGGEGEGGGETKLEEAAGDAKHAAEKIAEEASAPWRPAIEEVENRLSEAINSQGKASTEALEQALTAVRSEVTAAQEATQASLDKLSEAVEALSKSRAASLSSEEGGDHEKTEAQHDIDRTAERRSRIDWL